MKNPTTLQAVLAALAVLALIAASCPLLLNWVSPSAPVPIRVDAEQTIRFADGTLRFQSRGQGAEAVVFLHGFNGQLGDWNRVWGQLEHCGRAVRIDIPGFGGSDWSTDDFALPLQARRVMAFLDAIGAERVTLVGASMGGSLAAWMAAEHPERVRNVLLLAPSGYPDSLHYRGLFGLLVKPGWVNRFGTWVARRPVYRALFPDSRALQATTVTASYGPVWAQALKRISAPVLLIWSRGDKSFHAAAAVAADIKNSLLVPVAPEADHLLPETRPELAALAACRLAQGRSLQDIHQEMKPMLAASGDN